MPNKYVARLDGKIVGKRTSASRTYTHAIVVLPDVNKARDAAYNYVGFDHDRSNYEYECGIAKCEGVIIDANDTTTYKGPCAGQTSYINKYCGRMVRSYTAEEIADAKTQTAGGWDGYVALQRATAVERFEENLAQGVFTPGVATWCGRADLAQKEAAKHGKRDYIAQVWIVPAEKV